MNWHPEHNVSSFSVIQHKIRTRRNFQRCGRVSNRTFVAEKGKETKILFLNKGKKPLITTPYDGEIPFLGSRYVKG